MSYPANEEIYRGLIRRFLKFEVGAEAFCHEFMRLWKIDRDEEYAKCESWPERYDLQLMDAYQRGDMMGEEFERKSAELWGYAAYKPLVEMLGKVFTACDCFDPVPELEHEIDESQLRREVAENLASYEALKANRH